MEETKNKQTLTDKCTKFFDKHPGTTGIIAGFCTIALTWGCSYLVGHGFGRGFGNSFYRKGGLKVVSPIPMLNVMDMYEK